MLVLIAPLPIPLELQMKAKLRYLWKITPRHSLSDEIFQTLPIWQKIENNKRWHNRSLWTRLTLDDKPQKISLHSERRRPTVPFQVHGRDQVHSWRRRDEGANRSLPKHFASRHARLLSVEASSHFAYVLYALISNGISFHLQHCNPIHNRQDRLYKEHFSGQYNLL